ncbi:unnamed protein product [Prorocentrum cordatum]|uniref:Uncharacterized protein n=1 Tax=Prorocentrum cordatum TaxID=2364126 RepID=A0ABN9S2H5_9DINO|nr:unnamed protein product [Polarella glacialis]
MAPLDHASVAKRCRAASPAPRKAALAAGGNDENRTHNALRAGTSEAAKPKVAEPQRQPRTRSTELCGPGLASGFWPGLLKLVSATLAVVCALAVARLACEGPACRAAAAEAAAASQERLLAARAAASVLAAAAVDVGAGRLTRAPGAAGAVLAGAALAVRQRHRAAAALQAAARRLRALAGRLRSVGGRGR